MRAGNGRSRRAGKDRDADALLIGSRCVRCWTVIFAEGQACGYNSLGRDCDGWPARVSVVRLDATRTAGRRSAGRRGAGCAKGLLLKCVR